MKLTEELDGSFHGAVSPSLPGYIAFLSSMALGTYSVFLEILTHLRILEPLETLGILVISAVVFFSVSLMFRSHVRVRVDEGIVFDDGPIHFLFGYWTRFPFAGLSRVRIEKRSGLSSADRFDLVFFYHPEVHQEGLQRDRYAIGLDREDCQEMVRAIYKAQAAWAEVRGLSPLEGRPGSG